MDGDGPAAECVTRAFRPVRGPRPSKEVASWAGGWTWPQRVDRGGMPARGPRLFLLFNTLWKKASHRHVGSRLVAGAERDLRDCAVVLQEQEPELAAPHGTTLLQKQSPRATAKQTGVARKCPDEMPSFPPADLRQ